MLLTPSLYVVFVRLCGRSVIVSVSASGFCLSSVCVFGSVDDLSGVGY